MTTDSINTDLNLHLQVKEIERNHAWDEKFFKLFSDCKLKLLSVDPQQGPDGWPYLLAETTQDRISNASESESAQKIIHWLATRGIGLVINPRKLPYPDYVFSYGMLWSFKETGYFIKKLETRLEKQIILDAKSKVHTGTPTDEYLPKYVRTILKEFLRDQGVLNPKIIMLSQDNKNFDLCFSIESLGSPIETEHEGILEALSWFTPPHYSLALISELGLPDFQLL